MGLIYQRPLEGQGLEYGNGGQAYRTVCVGDKTGHSILHTLYGQALKYDCQFHVKWFALDLIMRGNNHIGITVMDMKPGTLHRLFACSTLLAMHCLPLVATVGLISLPHLRTRRRLMG
jgi:succinate dehydrogenase (ubiquinone) flavoprotein subunit